MGSNEGDVGTPSSALHSYQSATLHQNSEKCSNQTPDVLPCKKLPATTEDERTSSPDVMGLPLEYIHTKTSPTEEPEDVKEEEKRETITIRKV